MNIKGSCSTGKVHTHFTHIGCGKDKIQHFSLLSVLLAFKMEIDDQYIIENFNETGHYTHS